MRAQDWILTNTRRNLTIAECGDFGTDEGQVCGLDPLAFWALPVWLNVPTSGGAVLVFHDVIHGRNSKLALIFNDGDVMSGADVGTCSVSAGMASFFTPESYAATDAFYKTLPDDPYNAFFKAHDEDGGGERKIVTLPDGTRVPYVHSGWGNGGYPIFTLTDKSSRLCAIYIDFMGYGDGEGYLCPPGVTLN